jgi:ankyrin repeat protein
MSKFNSLIDPKKKAEILKRIHEGKEPFCAMKPKPEQPGKTPMQKSILEMSPNEKNQALIKLARLGDIGLVQQLLDAGADPNAKSENDLDITPLMAAIEGGSRVEMAKLLLKSGANVNTQTEKGYTALMYAATCGHDLQVDLLLATKGIDIYMGDEAGDTALDKAQRNNCLGIAEKIISAGNAKTK